MWNGITDVMNKIRNQQLKLGNKSVYAITEEQLHQLEKYMASATVFRGFLAAVLNSAKGSKMFNVVGQTWNPITGCLHYCRYCWARYLAMTRLKDSERYQHGFKPRFNKDELKKSFKGGVVFVSDMGDIFSPGVRDEWINAVIEHIRKFPDTYFLFLTKNPERYKDFIDIIPPNAILGATIETNKDDLYLKMRISYAPLPSSRYKAMKEIRWPLKFISIEPILDFDLEIFTSWIKEIDPFLVYVGYDNYEWRLPEPPLKKTLNLINELRKFTLVVRKTIRKAWNEELQTIVGYTTTRSKRKLRQTNEYERFKQYLGLMHEISLEIKSKLNESDRKYIELFFIKYYPTIREHYWTLKKLFSLAMYIPMFLQIGLRALNRGTFDGLIYVDTHAGPGLAKVGGDPDEIVPGSSLLALIWPKVIGEHLNNFRKVARGFDKLFYIEKDTVTHSVLNKILNCVDAQNAVALHGDSNTVLQRVKNLILKDHENPLILMFVDPFGEFSSQLLYKTFFEFTRDLQVDIIMNVNTPSLARGLMGKKSSTLELKKAVEGLWGDLCHAPQAKFHNNICRCIEDPKCIISINDVLNSYIYRLEVDGYRFVDAIPVEYKTGTIYHLLFASKGKHSHEWLGNYVEYLRVKAPRDYDILRKLWLQTTGKLKDLTKYVKQIT